MMRVALLLRGTKMLRIAVLSTLLYLSASASLSAEQSLAPPEQPGLIGTDEYIMVPKSQMREWYGEVLELVNQHKKLQEEYNKLKEFTQLEMKCS
jgi:hypothetical protein